jgi:hypothetical protein
MELSVSQLVVPKPPNRPGPPANLPANERSVWGQLVVGADEFAPARKLPELRRSSRLPLVILAVAVLGGGGFAAYWLTRDPAPATPAAAVTPPVMPSAPVPDAALAAIAIDAAPVAVDAAPPPITDPAAIDAVSGVATPIQPPPAVKRAKPIKKTATKPKPAPKKKRR